MGIDYNRVNIIAAVLERKGGINLSNYDIYVNVVGGIRLLETAADLSLAASMAGSFLDIPIKAGVVVFGEIGLAGEVRGVSQGAQRIAEAKKLGFSKVVVPHKNAEEPGLPKGIEVKGVRNVRDLIETLFEKK